MIGEPAHELFRSRGVAPLSLDVQKQRDAERGPRLHAASQNIERLWTVEKSVCACPDRALGATEQLFIHTPGIPSVQAWDLGTGPYKVGCGSPGYGLRDGPKPGGSGRSRDPEPPEIEQRREDVFPTLSPPQHRAEGSERGSRAEKARLERAGQSLAQVGREIEQGVDHATVWKNAASGTPSTGTTSARSR